MREAPVRFQIAAGLVTYAAALLAMGRIKLRGFLPILKV